MLRKLMKQEILASSRTYLPILAAVGGMALMAIATFSVNQSTILSLLTYSVAMLIIGAAGGFTIYNLIVSLGTRVYGKPGYLLFSVPAKTWQILLSKLLINLMWLFATTLVCVGCLLIMFQAIANMAQINILEALGEAFGMIYGELSPWDYVRVGLAGLTYAVYQIAFFMFLFSLLNLIYKGEKKVLIGILLYFGLSQVAGMLQSAVFGGSLLTMIENPEVENVLDMYWGTVLLDAALAVVFLGFTYHFMDKKMELQ